MHYLIDFNKIKKFQLIQQGIVRVQKMILTFIYMVQDQLSNGTVSIASYTLGTGNTKYLGQKAS